MKKYASVLLRVGMAVVVIWFGTSQLSGPSYWFGFLPSWTNSLPINQTQLVYLNGWFEISFGLCLLFGFYTRIVALFLALHLLEIMYSVGYSPIGVRDFGLTIVMFSIFLFGADDFSADNFFEVGLSKR